VTQWYDVRVVDRPAVVDAQITVQPPAYANLEPPDIPRGQTVVEVLPGSTVCLTITTNKPVVRAWLATESERLMEAGAVDPTRFSLAFRPTESASYSFELRDRDGLTGLRSVRFRIRLRSDRAPIVKLRMPGAGDLITPEAELPIELSAEDQYGLASADLVWEIAGSGQPVQRLAVDGFQAGSKRFDRTWTMPAAGLQAEPGQRLAVYAESADFDDVSGPNVGRSMMIALRVLALLDAVRRGAKSEPADVSRLVELERRQHQLGPRTAAVARQVEQLLGQMEVNQVANPSVRSRLSAGVVEPLDELARGQLLAAAEAMDALGQNPTDEGLQQVDDQLRAILQTLRSVLANMLKWEGYNEAVSLLRDIIQLQGEVHQETQEALERQLEDIFGAD
jgi:hypothetical protein